MTSESCPITRSARSPKVRSYLGDEEEEEEEEEEDLSVCGLPVPLSSLSFPTSVLCASRLRVLTFFSVFLLVFLVLSLSLFSSCHQVEDKSKEEEGGGGGRRLSLRRQK